MQGFFFTDSISQIILRPRTLAEAAGTFGQVKMWYRPLTQPVANYLLFPLFGFHFLPYHLLVLALHMLTSTLFFFALLALIRNEWAAFAGAWFFGIHAIDFYATYDSAFFAEPIMLAAYIGALWALLRRRYGLALGCLVLGLISKETSVTLFPLFVLLVVVNGDWQKKETRRRLILFASACCLVLLGYFAVYAQYFNLEGFSLISNQRPDYRLSIANVPQNYANYLNWIFQIPRTWMTEHWVSARNNLALHKALAVMVAVFAIVGFVRGNKGVRLAVVLFAFSALPTLMTRPFVHHAYLPLAAVAMVVGYLFLTLKRNVPGFVFVGIMGAFLAYQASITYRNVRRDNLQSWVGTSANHVRQAADVLQEIRPRLRPGVGLVIVNRTKGPIEFDIGGDSLPRLITGNENLNVHIVDEGDPSLPALTSNAVVLEYDGKTMSSR
jgi:hypothetical protein